MVPITNMVYNYDYAKRLHQGEGSFEDDWMRTIKIGGDFEQLYEESISLILELITKYSGFSWEENVEDYLPIYLIGSQPSFAQPLTLAVNDDPEIMLEDLIYQLAHRNMYFGFTTEELRDKCLAAVTDHVLSDLKLRKVEDKVLDLRQKPVKEYLRK